MEYIESYPVYVEPFHVDYTGRLLMGVLGNHLLNAADKHSTRRGWGIGTLNNSRHTWVLSRLSVELTQMPVQRQNVEIRTWVESVIKLFTTRNFAILDQDGNPMGYARSVWAMMDLDTRRPCDLLSMYSGDLVNHVTPEEQNVCPIPGHGRFRFTDPQLVRTINTYYSDADLNGHVNSMRYVEHILDLFPMENYKQGLRRFEIAYKAETYVGDTLSFYMQQISEQEYDIEVRKNETDVVCQSKVIFNSVKNQ